jgi:hypothetical protein
LSFLAQLQASAFSEWLAISMLGFPTLIALHSVGMAVVVGLSLMVTLRLFGFLRAFEASLVPKLLGVAIWGFTLNFITGLLLFITRGPEYITSYIFLVKMLLVIVSAAILFWLRQYLKSQYLQVAAAQPGAILGDRLARGLSLVATASWFSAVVAGRMIAYLSSIYR